MKSAILNIFIPKIDFKQVNKKAIFILTRPFLGIDKWVNDPILKESFGVSKSDTYFVESIELSEIVLIPYPINFYFSQKKHEDLASLNTLCKEKKLTAFGYISGDFGIELPEFSNIVYFRMGGFRSQLSDRNKGFPVALSDHFQRIYQMETIKTIAKRELPVVGFCGHATLSNLKRVKELAKCLKENGRRFLQNPFRKDWEPLFASAYERAQLLRYFEDSTLIKTNFIYRNQYRAGAQTDMEREETTLTYYDNIASSDYVLCVRGAGNFSVRFYETLMMGKTPVFVNTDCLLPFEDQIDWKQHVIWVEWKDRKNVAAIVSDFHKNVSNEAFMQLQLDNRKLWKERLSVKGVLSYIKCQN